MNKKEIEQIKFRHYRRSVFKRFDLWEKAVIRGREEDSEEVMNWFQEMLDFPDLITEDTTFVDYPTTPLLLNKYL